MAEPDPDPQHFQVREEVFPRDRHQVFSLVNSSGYFLPREMAYGMDMFDEHLMKGDISNYHFMLYADDTMLVACGCYGPIRLSDRRYLIHWMAVDKNYQHQGMGRRLEEAICKKIRLLGGVKVYAQTSNRDYHTAARAFYESCGYKSSSTIPDYYGDNDDMVFYAKDLVYR